VSVRGRFLVALLLAGWVSAAQAARLTVSAVDGAPLIDQAVAEGETWCLLWNHSVAGFEVEDCFETRSGRMVLVRSHLPDFAAGLDHVPGRGRLVSDGQGGYWVEGIDEAVAGNAFIVRPGGPNVDHRIRIRETVYSLSAMAGGERLRIALEAGAR